MPQEFSRLIEPTGNIYKTVAIISKRAKQVSLGEKEQLDSKINDFISHTEIKDNVDIQRQYEITKFYEKRSKPTIVATYEFLNGDIKYRTREDS